MFFAAEGQREWGYFVCPSWSDGTQGSVHSGQETSIQGSLGPSWSEDGICSYHVLGHILIP